MHIKRGLFGFGDKVSCIPGWAQTCYTAEAALELLILLPPFPDYWNYRHASMRHYSQPAENALIILTDNCDLTILKDLDLQHKGHACITVSMKTLC